MSYVSGIACRSRSDDADTVRRRTHPFAPLLAAVAALAGGPPAHAEPPTLHWAVPLPAGQGWRIVDLREGQGIRHEEYIPRGQGVDDYRDRILVQRQAAGEGMTPDTYLGYIGSGLAGHCSGYTTSGLVPGQRDGLVTATRTAYCGRFDARPYGYVIAQKVIRDGEHLFIVEREWRLPPFSVEPDGRTTLSPASPDEDAALKKDIRLAQRWLLEQVNPGAAPPPADPQAAPPPPVRKAARKS